MCWASTVIRYGREPEGTDNGRLHVGEILTLSQSSEGFAVLTPPWFIDMCIFFETGACYKEKQQMYTVDFKTSFE